MDKKYKTLMIACGILLFMRSAVLAAITINANPAPPHFHPTTGSPYYCEGVTSITVTADGDPPYPGRPCPDSTGHWVLMEKTYAWGGKASGQSASATVSLSTGANSVEVTVRGRWRWSNNSNITTRTTGRASQTYSVYKNTQTACTPPGRNPRNRVPLPDFSRDFQHIQYVPRGFIHHKFTETQFSNVGADERYVKYQPVVTLGCGLGFTETFSGGSISFTPSLAYGAFSVSLDVTGPTFSSQTANYPAVPFKAYYVQRWKRQMAMSAARLTAIHKREYYEGYPSGPNRLLFTTTDNVNQTVFFNPPDWEDAEISTTECTIDCCPNSI